MKLSKALMKQLGLVAPRKRAKPVPRPKPVALVGPPGSWSIIVPGYRPPSLARLLHMHWRQQHRLKKECADLIGHYGAHVPKATGKRRVLITLVRRKGRQARDDDNSFKAVLDGLVKAELLGNDSPEWVSCPTPLQIVGETEELRIEIEEIA